jgi:glycosyltransferase involved in cell wall biosynthesis
MVQEQIAKIVKSTNLFVVSHPSGNTFVRALVEELDGQGFLGSFHTTIGVGRRANPFLHALARRRSYEVHDKLISRKWFPELVRLLPFGPSSQEKKRRSADQSCVSLDRKLAERLHLLSCDVLHAYEDGAAHSFARAKELGVFCSYELPIAHWSTLRRLLAEEAERYPRWEPTLESTREPEEKLVRKDEELALANCITCPSEFVLQSIPPEIRKETPCQIAPFGSPADTGNTLPRNTSRKNGKLKLLFVGSMSQRKGLADLFEAMKLVDSPLVTLSILGRPSMPMHFYRSHYPNFKYLPPRSNEGVREVMLEHDVLVLPSIIEGRALVQQEAMACGLPLIVTRNAGGKDLIEEERTGFLVPNREPGKIAEKIDWFCQNLQKIDEMSEYCRNKASQYKWSEYARSIINFCLRNRSNSTDIQ